MSPLELPATQGEPPHSRWSPELLADVDRQYGLWSAMLAKVRQNVGQAPPQMIVYSFKEREQLQLMMDNMRQLSVCIGGERSKKIAVLAAKTRQVLNLYDDIIKQKGR